MAVAVVLSSRCLSQKAELPVVTIVIVEERIEIWPVGGACSKALVQRLHFWQWLQLPQHLFS